LFGAEGLVVFVDYAVYLYAGIRADCGTCGATDAGLGVSRICEVIAAVIYFFGLQLEHIGRACYYAEVATFAAGRIDGDCSMYFCHNLYSLRFFWQK
jgi:hypothetical protein